MIFHNCIECDYLELIPIADQCPMMQLYKCPECGTAQWIYHSRIDPKTYPLDAVAVDEASKSVRFVTQPDTPA